jgi:hypothetical protein
MPLHDRVRLHEVQAITSRRECAPQENPEHSVRVLDASALDATLHDGELVAKREILNDQVLASAS